MEEILAGFQWVRSMEITIARMELIFVGTGGRVWKLDGDRWRWK